MMNRRHKNDGDDDNADVDVADNATNDEFSNTDATNAEQRTQQIIAIDANTKPAHDSSDSSSTELDIDNGNECNNVNDGNDDHGIECDDHKQAMQQFIETQLNTDNLIRDPSIDSSRSSDLNHLIGTNIASNIDWNNDCNDSDYGQQTPNNQIKWSPTQIDIVL